MEQYQGDSGTLSRQLDSQAAQSSAFVQPLETFTFSIHPIFSVLTGQLYYKTDSSNR
jgi:hypothetical protein